MIRFLREVAPFVRGIDKVRNFAALATGDKRKHYERRLLKFPAEDVYQVVADTAKYKQFVPWCKESKVVSRLEDAGEASLVDLGRKVKFRSELLVGFGMFNEKYVSDVVLDPNTSISATSQDTKLLESLHTHWEFKPAKNPQHCWINFKVEFQFKSKLYNEFAGIFMDEVASKMVGAFEGRMEALTKR